MTFHMPHLRITLKPLAASLLHWRAGFARSFAAIRKEAGLFCESSLWKGEVLAYVGLHQNLKNLKRTSRICSEMDVHTLSGSSRSEAGLFCGSCLRKGEVLAYVGRIHNLKDLKDDVSHAPLEDHP